MEFDRAELLRWEEEQRQRETRRAYKTTKNYRCPRREALMDYRHHRSTGYHYLTRESAFIYRLTKRRLRRTLKRELRDGLCYRFTSRGYKTGGWLTW